MHLAVVLKWANVTPSIVDHRTQNHKLRRVDSAARQEKEREKIRRTGTHAREVSDRDDVNFIPSRLRTQHDRAHISRSSRLFSLHRINMISTESSHKFKRARSWSRVKRITLKSSIFRNGDEMLFLDENGIRWMELQSSRFIQIVSSDLTWNMSWTGFVHKFTVRVRHIDWKSSQNRE